MLKKAAHIILAFYLLTTIVGFTVTQHYCGDRLVSTQIDAVDECGCEIDSFDSAQHTCGMCDIETQYVHLSVHFVIEQVLNVNPVMDFVNLPSLDISNESIVLQNNIQTQINTSAPPLLVSRRLALIQSFRC